MTDRLRRYALALAMWGMALAATAVLAPVLVKTIFILFWPAVIASAWYAGRGPARLCLLLSLLSVDYLVVGARGFALPRDVADAISLLFFFVLGGTVVELTAAARTGTARARAAERDSAQRAAELQDQALELELQAEEVTRSHLELQRSESRFRQLFERNPQPMWMYDPGTLRFLDVNEAAVAQYGYTREEFLAMTLRDIRPPEEQEHLDVAIRESARHPGPYHGVFQHRRRDGTLVDVDITAQDVEHQGAPVRVILAVDVSDRERLLRAERAARENAENANRAKTEFLATMSHELRTPLNAIAGYADLLAMGIHGPVTNEQREALVRIQRSQRHLLGLINDVLNFAKLSAGRVEYDITTLSVRAVVDALEPLVAIQLHAKRLVFARDDCLESQLVRADEDKLRQILLNLLSNAIKFTPAGGKITLSCASDRPTVRITVRDTGIGIASDRCEHIFEPFVQIDRQLSSPHEGTGLGLAISRDLARAMGGDITVESEPGAGSTFTIHLPSARPQTASEQG